MKVFLAVLSFALVCYAQDDPIVGVCGEGTVLEGSFCVPAANEHAAPFVRTRDGAIELGIQGARLTLSAGDEHGTTDPTAEEYVTVREDFITNMVGELVEDVTTQFASQVNDRVSALQDAMGDLDNGIQGLQNEFGSFAAVTENTVSDLASDLQAQATALGEHLESELGRIETEMQSALEEITTQINDSLEGQLEQLSDFVEHVNETFQQQLFPPPIIQSCRQYKQRNPVAATGVYTVDPDGDGPIEPVETVCDMDTNDGGWTMFLRHEDRGNDRIQDSDWNSAIDFAAAGGIRKWLVKTYHSGRKQSTLNGDDFANAWVSDLRGNAQGNGFRHFRFQRTSCNRHRYAGSNWISGSQFVSGSSCRSFSYGGNYLWGEHTWCGTPWTGSMWMFGCSSPYSTSHLLYVNHGHGNWQTGVYENGHNYQSDVAFEWFYREN